MYNKNILLQSAPKVSVIVPVYNTELYVERAIVSLMEQTLDNVQFIIIDDGSKDHSLSIINDVIARYPDRQEHVILISRENRGVAATRSQGMTLATGDYVIHLDSDDWAEQDWLEAMYFMAIEDNADVVVCDYRSIHLTKSTHVKQPIGKDGVDCVKKLLAGELLGPTWNKLIKRKLLVDNKIRFLPNINFLEDFILVMQAFLAAHSISYVAKPLVNYNKCNESSITAFLNKQKIKEIVFATDSIDKILCANKLSSSLKKCFNNMKLNLKYWMLCCMNKSDFASVGELYPETDRFVFESSLPMHAKITLHLICLKRFTTAHMLMSLLSYLRRIIR